MSVDSTADLNRQIEDAQRSEYDDWLNSFDDDYVKEKSVVTQQESDKESADESIEDGHETVVPKDHSNEILKRYLSSKKPWKYSPAAELEERNYALLNLDHQLEFQVKRSQDAIMKSQKRWDKTAKKLDVLAETDAKFSVLTNDCKSKRLAHRKIQEKTQNDIKSYDTSILNDAKHLKNLNQLLSSMENRVKTYQPIRQFLRDVKAMSHGQFPTLRHATDRAIILENIRLRLMVYEWENENERRAAIQERYGLTFREIRNLLRASNERTQLCVTKNVLENELLEMENHLEYLKMTKRSHDVHKGKLKLCISNLYCELCKQLLLHPLIPNTKPMKQLLNIEHLMKQLHKLRNDIYRSSTINSDVVHMENDTQRTEKMKLKYKMW